MTNAGFPTRHEDRAFPLLISASVAAGAAMFIMLGILTVTSGASVRSDVAAAGTAAGTAIDHAVGRSGTVIAHRIVY